MLRRSTERKIILKKIVKPLISGTLAALFLMPTTAVSAAPKSKDGQWMTGEYHTHTTQSNDVAEPYVILENVLNAAFREDLDQLPPEADPNLPYGEPFDFIMLSDHLRDSPRDPDGKEKATARWEAIEAQMKKVEVLQESGKYKDKMIYAGFEWDMMGLDHASVAIIDSENDQVPVEAIHQFEWLYSYDTNTESFSSDQATVWGQRLSKDELKPNKEKAFEAIQWLQDNYPKSFVLPNHPSRHNGGEGEVTIADLRKMNDIAPNIVFGFEGMPGNQMSPDHNRAEMVDTYGGVDGMVAEVGGVWDALLGEGRRFWNFTNSDFHFKIHQNRQHSSGYWPSEYARNHVWVEGDTFKDVVDGMRSGKSFSVYGDLINALDFSLKSTQEKAEMGESLNVAHGEETRITIRFKSPEFNNYAAITEHETETTNRVEVDHIDLISGEVNGKVNEAEYASQTKNDTTKVVKTFTKEDWGEPDEDGFYTVEHTVKADQNRYYRLRGTNLEIDAKGHTKNGQVLQDQSFAPDGTPTAEENEERFNAINDRNYTSMWFYSNPIFMNVENQENKKQSTQANQQYTVKKGDTLSELALSFNTSLQQLASENKIQNLHKIYINQVIEIPGNV